MNSILIIALDLGLVELWAFHLQWDSALGL